MAKLDDDIEKAVKDFNYYLRNRQKYEEGTKKFTYYHERLIIREETLQKLLQRKAKNAKTSKGK